MAALAGAVQRRTAKTLVRGETNGRVRAVSWLYCRLAMLTARLVPGLVVHLSHHLIAAQIQVWWWV